MTCTDGDTNMNFVLLSRAHLADLEGGGCRLRVDDGAGGRHPPPIKVSRRSTTEQLPVLSRALWAGFWVEDFFSHEQVVWAFMWAGTHPLFIVACQVYAVMPHQRAASSPTINIACTRLAILEQRKRSSTVNTTVTTLYLSDGSEQTKRCKIRPGPIWCVKWTFLLQLYGGKNG